MNRSWATGEISKGDLKVLSYDVRIPWTLPEHDPAKVEIKAKRKCAALVESSADPSSEASESESDRGGQGRLKKSRHS